MHILCGLLLTTLAYHAVCSIRQGFELYYRDRGPTLDASTESPSLNAVQSRLNIMEQIRFRAFNGEFKFHPFRGVALVDWQSDHTAE
jgi:hypothetical protein